MKQTPAPWMRIGRSRWQIWLREPHRWIMRRLGYQFADEVYWFSSGNITSGTIKIYGTDAEET